MMIDTDIDITYYDRTWYSYSILFVTSNSKCFPRKKDKGSEIITLYGLCCGKSSLSQVPSSYPNYGLSPPESQLSFQQQSEFSLLFPFSLITVPHAHDTNLSSSHFPHKLSIHYTNQQQKHILCWLTFTRFVFFGFFCQSWNQSEKSGEGAFRKALALT